jgi:talin
MSLMFHSLKNVLAAQWQKERGIDKDVVKEWKKLTGMSEMNAKYRYVQFCRSLKTYGLTIFHVKEKTKNVKKLYSFMLGFTRDAIIRLDMECKVEKTWPLIYLKRWAASTDTFTMDFGSHEPDYVTVITEDGEAISQLIAGYIDILLKKQKGNKDIILLLTMEDSTVIIEDEKEEVAEVKSIGKNPQAIATATTVSYYGANGQSFGTSVTEVSSAPAAIAKMKSALLIEKVPVQENSALTPIQKKQQMTAHQKNVETVVAKLASLVTSNGPIDPTQLRGLAKQMSTGLENLLLATRTASSVGLDQSEEILESMKEMSDSLANLLHTADEASKDPSNPTLKVAVKSAQAKVNANFAKLDALQRNVKTDESYQKLFSEMSKAVSAAAINLVNVADGAKLTNVSKQGAVSNAREALSQAATQLAAVSLILAPTANDNKCKSEVLALKEELNNSVKALATELKSAGISDDDSNRLLEAIKGIQGSLIGLVSCVELPDISGGKDADVFSSASQDLLQSTTALMASANKPQAILSHIAVIEKSLESMKPTISNLSDNPVAQKRMMQEFKTLQDVATKLQAVANEASASPNNVKAQAQLRTLCQQMVQAAEVLINDGGEKVAVAALYNTAKEAAAVSTGFFVAVNALAGSIGDYKLEQDLLSILKLHYSCS